MLDSGISQPIQQEDGVNLHRLIQPLLQHWKRVFLIWVSIVSVTVIWVMNKKPEFVSSGTLYISDSKGGSSQFGTLSDFIPEIGSGSDIESQKELLQGTDLVIRLITKLGFNAQIEGDPDYLVKHPSFWQWRRAGRDPRMYDQGLKVKQSETSPGVYAPVIYLIRFIDSQSFELVDPEGPASPSLLGQPVRRKEASFVVTYDGEEEIKKGSEFKIRISPPELIVHHFRDAVLVKAGGKGTQKNNLIYVTYRSDSPYISQSFVEALLQEFIAQNRMWATSVSRAMLEFVDIQQAEMRAELEKSGTVLSQFQRESGLVSLEPQVQADLKRLIDYEVQLRNEQLKLFELERLVESLKGGQPDQYLLPYAQDLLIQNMGAKLADIATQIGTLQSQFQQDYPPLKLLRAEQKALLSELKSAIQNYLDRVRLHEQQLAKTVREYKNKFESLPEESKSLTEYLRSTKVYEELFLFLLQEKQKAKIAEASTLSSIRVVDEARLPLRESAPNVASTMLLVAVIGLFIAAGAVLIPAWRVRWFTNLEEVENYFSHPIFALIPHRQPTPERGTPAVLEQQPQSRYSESIRLLRTNLLRAMAGKRHQTILVTSPLPGDGKTSTIANLAATLIKSERVERVLLIDADLHRPSLHSVFGLLPSPGLSNYLNGEAALVDIIRPVTIGDGKQIDVICAGPIPPTPVELIETKAMQELLDDAQGRYTFTLIDSTPYPLITSAAILAAKVDRVLVAMRIGYTDRSVLSRHVNDLTLINRNLGLVVAVSEPGGDRYGYGYSYGYDNGYGYGNGHANGNGGHKGRSLKNILQQLRGKWGPVFKK